MQWKPKLTQSSITTVFTLIFIASDVMIMLKNEIVHSKKEIMGIWPDERYNFFQQNHVSKWVWHILLKFVFVSFVAYLFIEKSISKKIYNCD